MKTWTIDTWTHGRITVTAASKTGALRAARAVAATMGAILQVGSLQADNLDLN